MSYRVRTDSFEGPFDLLLYLVSRQKVDIGAINITQIADQYLAEVGRMQNLDLDVASDFLLVASTLLEIKAQSLLPREHIEVEDDIAELAPSEARDMLVERLLEYKQYKNAAAALHARFVAEGRMPPRPFGPEACFLNLMPARCSCWKASISPRSPFRWRCTCAPSISASATSSSCASRS